MISETFLSLADAAAQPASPGGIGSMAIPMACIGVIFYFLIIRPQNQRQKEADKLTGALKTGDKVVTSSGIHGIIANVKEGKTLILKIADGVKIEIDKSAIATIEKSTETSPAPVAAS